MTTKQEKNKKGRKGASNGAFDYYILKKIPWYCSIECSYEYNVYIAYVVDKLRDKKYLGSSTYSEHNAKKDAVANFKEFMQKQKERERKDHNIIRQNREGDYKPPKRYKLETSIRRRHSIIGI